MLDSQYDTLIYGLANSNSIAYTGSEQEDNSLIKITDSTFDNLNYGGVITTLSLLNNATLPIAELSDIEYPTFDNHGSVLNLQGFPGGVKVSGSTIKRNMAFIPDVYPTMRSEFDEIDALADYQNAITGQITTTRCNDTSVTRNLLSDFLNPVYE